MKKIRFTSTTNLKEKFKKHHINGNMNLLDVFTIKSDILNSNFLYEYDTHDSIKVSKLNISKMMDYFEANSLDFKVTSQIIKQHSFIISEPSAFKVEQKQN